MFKRKTKQSRMVRVCEKCYQKAPLVDRPLMVMVQDSECEFHG